MAILQDYEDLLDEVKWFVNHHECGVWMVPVHNGYKLVTKRPTASEILAGRSAQCFDTNLEVVYTMPSSRII